MNKFLPLTIFVVLAWFLYNGLGRDTKKIPSPLIGKTDDRGKLGLELGVYATPETFVVDKKGVIRFKRIGDITPSIWQQQILPLIEQLQK
ncbi:hypothetical protein [Bathymodiolus thermophilus thioautotrophic gill symbiont]|uniref:Alkyl hydroperoxide reductase subunit C/ Thiol specific antioxidant domain-containing protein n=1 Tax=Bathymodiolus thermophilus thioautotrophic gill symbiont TaxID=2360 RepID=A0A1J5U6G6_9GAMM|nr:hypothetical protein [Bathymodiolus thermophilus thioautotrophic gill symbiont]OIR23993.1 hypothetical protein BGC33_08900 [Bathymodiolus thermophilus thioautotrophic gill symbiont]